MYAIVVTGGKQYKVEKDNIIKVEKLDLEVGEKIDLEVVLVSDGENVKCGKDVASSKVTAEVVAQDKAKKILVYKYKAKKNERKRQGHRQPFTVLKITEVIA